jgi:hypothetical protein
MKHFTLEELTHTNTGLENTPTNEVVTNLQQLVENVLDPVREIYGKPITVNCGYRSPEVNRKVGGVANSQHLKGEAADISAGSKRENAVLYEIIRLRGKFDQLINEKDFSWIHVSYTKNRNRMQTLKL